MQRITLILVLILAMGSGLVWAQRGVGVKGQATPYIKGTYRALVIGNDAYRDPEGLWKPLKTAVNDARAVADVLKNLYGFGDVRLLLNATRRQMGRAFNQIAAGMKCRESPTARTADFCSASSIMVWQSSEFIAIGFSTKTSTPRARRSFPTEPCR